MKYYSLYLPSFNVLLEIGMVFIACVEGTDIGRGVIQILFGFNMNTINSINKA